MDGDSDNHGYKQTDGTWNYEHALFTIGAVADDESDDESDNADTIKSRSLTSFTAAFGFPSGSVQTKVNLKGYCIASSPSLISQDRL